MLWLHLLLYPAKWSHVLIRSNTLCFNYLSNVNLDKHYSLPCSVLCAKKRDNCHFHHSLNNALSVEYMDTLIPHSSDVISPSRAHHSKSISHKKWYYSTWRRILKYHCTLLSLNVGWVKTGLLNWFCFKE